MTKTPNRLSRSVPTSTEAASNEIPSNTIEQGDEPLILLVDDHADVRTYVRSRLQPHYRILEAESGRTGVSMAVESVPDLIISDVMMPVMDGYQLCERLKTDERTSHIPIILLTARAAEQDKLTGLDTGADDYLVKPFSAPELLARVQNMIVSRQKLRDRFLKDWLQTGENLPVSSTEEVFLKKLRSALDENMAEENFGIDHLSAALGIGKRQLQRKIRALTNDTAGNLIRAARLERARHLLENNTGTISEIAYSVGFNHLSYFSRCYRERFGILPSAISKKD